MRLEHKAVAYPKSISSQNMNEFQGAENFEDIHLNHNLAVSGVC